jgi:uncharacterized protein
MVEDQSIESKQVSWLVDDIPVYGTLTYPLSDKLGCGVVFVAGSGPTDRDWCSPLLPGTNGSGKLLAELLSKQGFVTLRYDKRASGPYAQENVPKLIGRFSMQSHLDELSGAIKTLLQADKINKDCLFALTNSEGAIHTLNYQLQTKNIRFKGLILTGPPGRAIGKVARSQIEAQIKNLSNADAIMKAYDNAVEDFVEGKPVVPQPSLPQGIQQLLMGLAYPANLPFAKELWIYDPTKNIGNIDVPMLIVIGKKDIQINWQTDGAALEAATAKNSAVTFAYPPNANHVLKNEPTPREQLSAQSALRYNAADTELDPETVGIIVDWLKKHAD